MIEAQDNQELHMFSQKVAREKQLKLNLLWLLSSLAHNLCYWVCLRTSISKPKTMRLDLILMFQSNGAAGGSIEEIDKNSRQLRPNLRFFLKKVNQYFDQNISKI